MSSRVESNRKSYIRSRNRLYYLKNQDKIRKQQLLWQRNNRDKLYQYQRTYYKKHKDKVKEISKKWRQSPKGKKSTMKFMWKSKGITLENFDENYNRYLTTTQCDLCSRPLTNCHWASAKKILFCRTQTVSNKVGDFKNIVCGHCYHYKF